MTGGSPRNGVTVAAVFWALAVGIAAGAGAVGSRVVDQGLVEAIEGRLNQMETRLARSAGELGRMRAELGAYRRALELVLPDGLRAHVLPGLPVRVRATPGASGPATALVQVLTGAGAAAEKGSPLSYDSLERPGEVVVLEADGATVVGVVGSWPHREPPALLKEAGAPAGGSSATAWVDQVETPLGMLAAVQALTGRRTGYVSAEEAMAGLARSSGGVQRRGAGVAGGGPHTGHR